ncbi:PREDICTED: putative leucine-rich repeat-containing protein DDB_G0290503 [Ceratosolen solmsi marchali]|uniref:Leucine-rich repeat-containing protein DDB_G0290503 n=1 Tax=Ceratosolen solmsi marchali TaxID=326594 RepID=A0AAJ7DYB2_9HYME|nr:PREDICTED: putative leucine-rich repeat-containing protein DDB_G0290503 [Ceratosolen solmsi marchali]
MSIPSTRLANSDAAKDGLKVSDKPNKVIRKSLSGAAVKSKIPKQGKSIIPVACKETNNEVSVTSENAEEKLSAPPSRPVSKSQEKPPTVIIRPRANISAGSENNEKRVLENKFNQKKNRYVTLARDIEDKQKLSITSFKELYRLREKILSLGGKDPGHLDDLNPLGTWFVNIKNGNRVLENVGSTDDKLVTQFETNLSAIAESSLALCNEVLNKRKDIVIWLTNFEREFWDDPSPLTCKEEMIHQCKSYEDENVEFEKKLDSIRQEQLLQIKELVLRMGFLWQECQIYRQDNDNGDNSSPQNMNYEEHLKELRLEKDKSLKIRVKLREQENAIANSEKKLRQAQENIQRLEIQLKQKDANVECKAKELAKFQKTHETVIGKSEKQKETLESRLIKLKEEVECKENEVKNIENDYKQKIENMEFNLNEEYKQRQELECQFNDFKIRYAKLEEKCKELLEIPGKKKEVILDNHHTEYEIQLFTDLKKTQTILAEKEKIIQKLQIERNEIIETVNETDQENNTSNKKLTAEVLKKSNEIQTLKGQFTQLQKNYKKLQQKEEQLEDKLLDMSKMQSQMKDGNRNVYNTQIMQLQQQVSDLRSNLADVNIQNKDLEKTCMQLQLKNEHYERYMRNQDKDCRVRKEMQQLLEHNEDGYIENFDQNTFSPINNEEFKQLYATLESKEMQIIKLEKLVKQMEKQEEHSQLQRTRLENRIAKLEVALKEGQQAHRSSESKRKCMSRLCPIENRKADVCEYIQLYSPRANRGFSFL